MGPTALTTCAPAGSANRNGGDLLKIRGSKDLHLVQPAHCDIGELSPRCAHQIDVVRNRSGVDHTKDPEWRLRGKHHCLADILQREPDLLTIGRGRNVRTEWRNLL